MLCCVVLLLLFFFFLFSWTDWSFLEGVVPIFFVMGLWCVLQIVDVEHWHGYRFISRIMMRLWIKLCWFNENCGLDTFFFAYSFISQWKWWPRFNDVWVNIKHLIIHLYITCIHYLQSVLWIISSANGLS